MSRKNKKFNTFWMAEQYGEVPDSDMAALLRSNETTTAERIEFEKAKQVPPQVKRRRDTALEYHRRVRQGASDEQIAAIRERWQQLGR